MDLKTTTHTVDAALDQAVASVTGELGRTDGKASLLLAFDGAVLAGLASVADQPLPLLARISGSAAVLALAVAAVLLLLVVRPRLTGIGGPARGTFPQWAALDEDEIRAVMQDDTRAARVRTLSAIAVSKFQRLALAVDVSLAAVALLLFAAAVTAAGALR
jgi:hypothetical protein